MWNHDQGKDVSYNQYSVHSDDNGVIVGSMVRPYYQEEEKYSQTSACEHLL